jgi:formate dehydrogenase subunit gamma
MSRLLIRNACAAAVVLATLIPAVAAAAGGADSAAGPPSGFVAPAEPQAGETEAVRAKTQPGNNAPLWRAVRQSGYEAGTTTPGGPEKGVLIQPLVRYPGSAVTTAGEAWRQVRNRVIIPYGGSLLVIVALAIAMFYWRVGALGGHRPDTGRTIERFTFFERAAHWSAAICFVVLAISGLMMSFGKFFIEPVLGALLYGWLTYVLKTLHNLAGPLFAVALVVVIVTFVKDNVPKPDDVAWLAKGGGLLGEHEVPSHRFNAGEKVIFWVGIFVLGLIVAGSGLVLDKLVPSFGDTRAQMQVMQMIHSSAAMLMMVVFCGHIYIGTIGMKGAYKAMRTGYVDEAWAEEHHELWAADIRAGKIPAQRSQAHAPAATSHAA